MVEGRDIGGVTEDYLDASLAKCLVTSHRSRGSCHPFAEQRSDSLVSGAVASSLAKIVALVLGDVPS